MSSVTFDVAVGGDGSTVTDDNNATTGLRDGGWKTRFVPCFTQQVAVANYIVTKAGEASTSASAASASATAAAASYDSFDDRYLGSKTSDPSVDNDGNALITGAIYWNSSSNVMKVWSGSAWVSYNPAINYLALSGGTMTGAITFAAGQTISATSLKSATTDIAISSATAPTTGQVLTATSSTAATWQTLPSSIASVVRSSKTSAYTLVAGDKGTLIEVTSGTFTLSLTAAATLGSGWWCYVSNIGTGLITIDPNSSETITVNGTARSTWVQWTTEVGILQCDGTGFNYYQMQKGYTKQTVSSAVNSIIFSSGLSGRSKLNLSTVNGNLNTLGNIELYVNSSTPDWFKRTYSDPTTPATNAYSTSASIFGGSPSPSSGGYWGFLSMSIDISSNSTGVLISGITGAIYNNGSDRNISIIQGGYFVAPLSSVQLYNASAIFSAGTYTLTEL